MPACYQPDAQLFMNTKNLLVLFSKNPITPPKCQNGKREINTGTLYLMLKKHEKTISRRCSHHVQRKMLQLFNICLFCQDANGFLQRMTTTSLKASPSMIRRGCIDGHSGKPTVHHSLACYVQQSTSRERCSGGSVTMPCFEEC